MFGVISRLFYCRFHVHIHADVADVLAALSFWPTYVQVTPLPYIRFLHSVHLLESLFYSGCPPPSHVFLMFVRWTTETHAGKKRTRVATNLRGNFIPLGGGANSARASVSTSTPAKKKKFSCKIGSSHRDGVTRSNRNDDGGKSGSMRRGGEAESSLGGSDPTAQQAGPAAAGATVGGRQAESESGGIKTTTGGASGSAACAGSGGVQGQAPPPTLSLLERIRRDAKKKRRQDAAAAAAAAAAVGQNEQR